MKKIVCVMCITCLILVALTSCSNEPDMKNVVAPKTLSQDQKDIVDLLSTDKQEIILFVFQTEDTYKSMAFWVEIYENGELIDRLSGVNLDDNEAMPLDGQCAVLINHNEGMTFSFTLSTNGVEYSTISEPVNIDRTLARGYGSIDAPVEIVPGKEIILYTSIYSADGIKSYIDQQIYIEQPELLSSYPYVQIIKCKFE